MDSSNGGGKYRRDRQGKKAKKGLKTPKLFLAEFFDGGLEVVGAFFEGRGAFFDGLGEEGMCFFEEVCGFLLGFSAGCCGGGSAFSDDFAEDVCCLVEDVDDVGGDFRFEGLDCGRIVRTDGRWVIPLFGFGGGRLLGGGFDLEFGLGGLGWHWEIMIEKG